MKRRFGISATFFAILAAVSGTAGAKNNYGSIRQEIQANIDRYCRTMMAIAKTKDYDRIDDVMRKSFAPDYVSINYDGKTMNLKHEIENQKKWFASMSRLYRYDCRAQRMTRVDKNTCVGNVNYNVSYDTTDPKTGKTHRITLVGTERDTHIKLASKMKQHRYDIKNQKIKLLGKNKALVIALDYTSWDEVDLKTGKIFRNTFSGREREIWVKTPSGWKYRSFAAFEGRNFRDGKPGPFADTKKINAIKID